VLKEVSTGGLMAALFEFRGTWKPTVWGLLSETVVTVDAVDCAAGIPPSRSLKYSESLREELRTSRFSRLRLTSAQGQS